MEWLLIPPAVLLVVIVCWFWRQGVPPGNAIQYFIFLRYQWSLAILLACFPWIAHSGILDKYLSNLLAVDSPLHILFISLFSFLATVPLILATELTLRYGPLRFGIKAGSDCKLSNRWFIWMTGRCADRNRQVGILHMLRFLFGVLLSAPIVWWVVQAALEDKQTTSDKVLLLGIVLLAYAMGAWLIRIALYVRNRLVTSPPVVDILYLWLDLPLWFFNTREHSFLQKNTKHLADNEQAADTAQRPSDPHWLEGYRPRDKDKPWKEWAKRWYPGHLSGLFLFVACFGAFVTVILLFDPWSTLNEWFPPLGFVLLLLGFLNWLLPATAFFFDRWRLPVPILLVGIWGLSTLLLSNEGHYYRVQPLDAPTAEASKQPLTAEAATTAWLKERRIPQSTQLVIVTAAGGGIVASAWTAEALTAIEAAFGEEFTDRLFAISSVSGGSVGTLYYMLDFQRDGLRTSRARVSQAARASSVAATAWGVVARDFWRFAKNFQDDRATAMEQSWKNSWMRQAPPFKSFIWPTLHLWRQKVRDGKFPIILFNATSVETGSPYLFTPIDIRTSGGGQSQDAGRPPWPRPFAGFGNFIEDYRGNQEHNGYDVECVAAARLSATFPWVTPVACASEDGQRAIEPTIHLADGGYFDNFGIATIVELIFATSATLRAEKIDTVIVIDISPWSRGAAQTAAQKDSRLERLFLQATAPFVTLYSARGTSQAGRAASEIHLLADAFEKEGEQKITLEHFPVFMDKYVAEKDFRVPLSWHLDRKEVRVVHAAAAKLREVLAAVKASPPPSLPPSTTGINEEALRSQWLRLSDLLRRK